MSTFHLMHLIFPRFFYVFGKKWEKKFLNGFLYQLFLFKVTTPKFCFGVVTWGTWQIRTAVHGFADRWLSHSSKVPDTSFCRIIAVQRYVVVFEQPNLPLLFFRCRFQTKMKIFMEGNLRMWKIQLKSTRGLTYVLSLLRRNKFHWRYFDFNWGREF